MAASRFLERELDLRASGTVSMVSSANPIWFGSGTLRVSSGATLTASGANWFSNNGGTNQVIVHGTLIKTGSGTLTVAPSFTNTGTLDVTSGTVNISASLPQISGTTLTGGTWIVRNGTLSTSVLQSIRTLGSGASITLDGTTSIWSAIAQLGTISAGGSAAFVAGRDISLAPISGTFVNNGTFTIGVGSDANITGAYQQGASGVLETIVGAVTDTPLAVSASASLGGGLFVTHGPGFTPPMPSSITLLTASVVSGTFAIVETPVGSGSSVPPPVLYGTNNVVYNIVSPVTVDLVASDLSAPRSSPVGSVISLSWTMTNEGDGPAQGPWNDRVLLSMDAALGDDLELTTLVYNDVLDAAGSVTRKATVTLPSDSFGTRHLIVVTDVGEVVEESDERNNVLVAGMPIELTSAELVASDMVAPPVLIQGQPALVTWTVTNVGNALAPAFVDTLRWSVDPVLSGDDVPIGEVAARGALGAGGSANRSLDVTIPLAGTIPLGDGYLIISVDDFDSVPEPNAADNLQVAAVTVEEPPLPNLRVSTVSPPASGSLGSTFELTWTIMNDGELATSGGWTDRVYLSSDTVWGGDTLAATSATAVSLAAGASVVRTATINAPLAAGSYWVFIETDALNSVVEASGEGDNLSAAAGPIAVDYAPSPDLRVTAIDAPATAVATEPVALSYTVTNEGELAASGLWLETVSISSDGAIGGDTIVGQFWRIGTIDAGASALRSEQVLLPLSLVGTKRLVVTVDATNAVDEANPAYEANNAAIDESTMDVIEPPLADLVISGVSASAEGFEGEAVSVSWSGTNQGELATPASWSDSVYLSSDTTLGSGDLLLGTRVQVGSVAGGAAWSGSITVILPSAFVGVPAHLIVLADAADVVEEGSGDASNASAARPIMVLPSPKPNLVPGITSLPSSWLAGSTVQIGWEVSNGGEADAVGPWSDGVYLSTDPTLSGDDTTLRVQPFSGTVAVGSSYTRAAGVTLPVDYLGGTRYLLVATDINAAVPQSNHGDDVIASGAITLEPTPAADLVLSNLATSTPELVFGAAASFTWTASNQGTASASETWSDILLLSTDPVESSDDLPVALVGSGGSELVPGASVLRSTNATLPLANGLADGTYWLIARADANGAVSELSEANNAMSLGPVAIVRPPLPDLEVSISGMPSDVAAGEPFTMELTFTNVGASELVGTFFTTISIEQGTSDLLLQEFLTSGGIASGASVTVSRSVTIPAVATPTVQLTICADSDATIVEGDEVDNCAVSPALPIRRPDLRVTSISGPANATAGATVTVSYTVTNEGSGPASGFATDAIRLSVDELVGDDRLLTVTDSTQTIQPGQSVVRSASVTIPAELEGSHRFVVHADAGTGIIELDELDNAGIAPAAIEILPAARPNLIVESVSAPATVLVGASFPVTFTVRNIGEVPTSSAWVDGVALSANSTLTVDDATVGTALRVAELAPGASYLQTVTCIAPATPGSFTLFATADSESNLLESADIGDADNSASPPSPIAIASVVASVTALEGEVLYGTSMPVLVSASVEGSSTPAPGIPITLRTWVRGYPSDRTVTTGAAGTVTVDVEQTPNLAGVYSFGVAVPGTTPVATSQTVVWGVSVALDRASLLLPEQGGGDGTITIRNMGDVPVTGLSLAATSQALGVDVESFLPNGGVLGPDESRVATWLASASAGAEDGAVDFLVTCDQAADVLATLPTSIVAFEPALVATPSPLERTMLVGAVTYTTVTIRNVGTAPTGELGVLLSNAPWLELVSPPTLASLAPGAETSIELRLAPAEDLPLGSYSAAPFLVVKDLAEPTVSAAVNGVFTASSDEFATVAIEARNEFSYYGVPPSYPEASVEIRPSGSATLVAGGPVDASGNATFERLTAGLYDIKVTAPGHGSFSQTRLLEPGQNEVSAFLPKQVVSYEWTVIPIPFTDEYTITVNLVFETNVPAPVITFDPLILDFRAMTQPAEYREINVTNHGLVTAREFRWEASATERYEIIPLFDEIGDIPAGQTITAPVLMVDHQFGSGDEGGVAGGTALACLGPGLSGVWLLQCGGTDQAYRQAVGTIINEVCDIEGLPQFAGGTPGEIYNGGEQPAGGGAPAGVNGPPVFVTVHNCEECALKCLEAINNAYGLGFLRSQLMAALGKAYDHAITDCYKAAATAPNWQNFLIDCLSKFLPPLGHFCNAMEVGARCTCGDFPGGCGGAWGGGDPGFLFSDDGTWSIDLPETDDAVVKAYNIALERVARACRPRLYELGTPRFLIDATNEDDEILSDLIGAIGNAVVLESEQGEIISAAEATLLIDLPKPPLWTTDHIVPFIERWNRTREYAALGWYNAVDVPEGLSIDFIEADVLAAFVADGTAAIAELEALGYENPFQEVIDATDLLLASVENGQGKCVTVAIELEQTVTLVRQAFAATLALTNETDAPIEAITVSVMVKDLEGNDASGLFAFLGPDLVGLSDVNGNGSLDPDATGSATWTLIPGDSAAADGPTQYVVSGSLSYASGGQVVAFPLFPVQITVLPNASLSMQYFIETQVYGDDPFTPEFEPSVPFSLGLWAKNDGGGTASDVTVVSAQPEIVENEEGALIDFLLIGSQVNETPISPSLTVAMGDILPGEVAVAQWLMISSLQGEFTGYSATIQSTNGFSDPEFAIVDEAAVNAMTHVVRADEPFDDGRPDFLGNVVPNAENLPDRVYLSNSAVEPVTAIIDGEAVQSGELEYTLTVAAADGWRYLRIDDPFAGSRTLTEARRSDGKILRLGDNAWQTSFIDRSTPEPVAKRHLHLFDRGGDGIYVLTFASDAKGPVVETWTVVMEHAGLEDAAFDVVPASQEWSEPRAGGIALLTLSFSEPIDPSTAIPAHVALTAHAADGSEVNLDAIDRAFVPRLGNQFADLVFTPPLPENLRYCIRLVDVKDLAGNIVDAKSGRIDLAVLPGDLTNDLRVTVNDGGALASLMGTSPIDPLDPYQVRADVNRDGAIDLSDLSVVLAQIGLDLRFVPGICADLGSERATTPSKPSTLEPTTTEGAPMVTDGGVSGGTSPALSGDDGSSGSGEGAASERPSTRSVLLGRDGDLTMRGGLRQDLLAIRPTTMDELAAGGVDAAAIAAIFGLATHEPTLDSAFDAGWRLIVLPEPLRVPLATATLSRLLRAEGLEVAAVVEPEVGQLAAVLDDVQLVRRRTIPLSWCERVLRDSVAKAGLVGAVVRSDGRSILLALDSPKSSTREQLVQLLIARREFESVEAVMVPLGEAEWELESSFEEVIR
ncbi:MAG: hypothetical protein JNL80_02295 [Phycisphaerae bacterium]|nr:hypothetical protein [Phycisphaerae bacterium]